MDDDGPLVKLRWLYRPDEIPTSCLKVRADSHDQVVRCNLFKLPSMKTDLRDHGDSVAETGARRSAGGERLTACYKQKGNYSQCSIVR